MLISIFHVIIVILAIPIVANQIIVNINLVQTVAPTSVKLLTETLLLAIYALSYQLKSKFNFIETIEDQLFIIEFTGTKQYTCT